MKITILNGNTQPGSSFDQYLGQLDQKLTGMGHQVSRFDLHDLKFSYCIGCFGCWVKSPGECRANDDSAQVCDAMVNSDFMLWAAPLRMGYPEALLKKIMDKTIPLIHPYFTVDHGEAHHRARYSHYPRVGLLTQLEAGSDAADLRIVTDMYTRTAINLKSRLEFVLTTSDPLDLAAAAIHTPGKPLPVPAYPSATQGVRITPPHHITVFNGSPRGKKGNSPILLEQLMKGFTSLEGNTYEVHHLNHIRQADEFAAAYEKAEAVMLGFPLYTDAMPGIVKQFIESLEPYKNRPNNPPIGFLVQSGFPEARHSRFVEQYLKKFIERMGSPFLGVLLRGSCEGIRLMPESMTRSVFSPLQQLGRGLAENGLFDPALVKQFAGTEAYPAYLVPVFKLLENLPLLNTYWNKQLKQNGVYEKRFAMPYQHETD